MRELERDHPTDTPHCARLAIIGRGRLGTALDRALSGIRYDVVGPLGRGADAAGAGAGAAAGDAARVVLKQRCRLNVT